MNKTIISALLVTALFTGAQANGKNTVVVLNVFKKTYKLAARAIRGPRKQQRSASTQAKFRKDSISITDKNKHGRLKDAYTGKHHDPKDMQADHIWPHSKGGSNSSWNSAMTHKTINGAKSNKLNAGQMARGYAGNKVVQGAAIKTAAGGALIGGATY